VGSGEPVGVGYVGVSASLAVLSERRQTSNWISVVTVIRSAARSSPVVPHASWNGVARDRYLYTTVRYRGVSQSDLRAVVWRASLDDADSRAGGNQPIGHVVFLRLSNQNRLL